MTSEHKIIPEPPINSELEAQKPYERVHDEGFLKLVQQTFGELLQDRATEPGREGSSKKLYDFGERILKGEKIPYDPATSALIRGVFGAGGPLEAQHITQGEIDVLEHYFLEK